MKMYLVLEVELPEGIYDSMSDAQYALFSHIQDHIMDDENDRVNSITVRECLLMAED